MLPDATVAVHVERVVAVHITQGVVIATPIGQVGVVITDSVPFVPVHTIVAL